MLRCAAPTLLQKGLGTEMYLLCKEDGTTGGIQQIVVAVIDGKTLHPGIWYGVELEKGW